MCTIAQLKVNENIILWLDMNQEGSWFKSNHTFLVHDLDYCLKQNQTKCLQSLYLLRKGRQLVLYSEISMSQKQYIIASPDARFLAGLNGDTKKIDRDTGQMP